MKHASVDRAKRVCTSCRNNGSCPWCRRSRTMDMARVEQDARHELIDAVTLLRQPVEWVDVGPIVAWGEHIETSDQ